MKSPPVDQARERLDRLYRDHARSVYRCARARMSVHDAEDVVCEVFAVAWRRIDAVPQHELGWLLRTTRNVMANQLRASARRAALTVRLAGVGSPADGGADHAHEVAGRDVVEQLLATLPARDQEVLRLLVLADLSVPELATALGCRPNTASARVRRAKDRLARAYAQQEGPDAHRAAGTQGAGPGSGARFAEAHEDGSLATRAEGVTA